MGYRRRGFFVPPVRLSFMAVGLSVFLFLAAASAVMFFEFPSAIGAERKLPIYSVDRPDKKISISFDAAWGNEHTKPILDALDQYHVKATFFLVNFWAEKFPEDVKEIAARGHEVQNHSATHPDLTSLSPEQIQKEIDGAGQTIEKLTGVKPTLLRPPFGSYNNTVIDTAESMGYKVVQWEVDSLDWKSLTTEQIVERVTRNVKPGSIVLFHNNAEHVEQYLPIILDKLQAEGYEIVPIGQLIYQAPYHMDRAGKQIYDGPKENQPDADSGAGAATGPPAMDAPGRSSTSGTAGGIRTVSRSDAASGGPEAGLKEKHQCNKGEGKWKTDLRRTIRSCAEQC